MFRAYGLYTHIRANRIRSVLLLLGFVALLHALLFSLLLILNAFGGGDFEEIFAHAVDQFAGSWPIAMAAAGIWFLISWLFHQQLIRLATGAHGISRREAPKIYNVLENLCISRGIPMPALQIIETPALNAYAAGLKEGQYVIAVTRGLVDTLSDDELEAVLGHELTHIRNRDAQLMVIAIIMISWGLSTLIRFALSRSREYLADAGSVELTKNPDAMIRALRKIERNARLGVPSRMEAFFIENPLRGGSASLLSTHPSIEDRVAALERFAGGLDLAQSG
jgi:heat shock protein HtpX